MTWKATLHRRGDIFSEIWGGGKVCVHTDKMKWSWKGEAGKIQQSNTKFSKFNELWDLNFHYIWDTLSSIQNQSPLFLLLCCEVNALNDPWPFQVTHATVNVGLRSCLHTQSYLFYLLIDTCFPRNCAIAKRLWNFLVIERNLFLFASLKDTAAVVPCGSYQLNSTLNLGMAVQQQVHQVTFPVHL